MQETPKIVYLDYEIHLEWFELGMMLSALLDNQDKFDKSLWQKIKDIGSFAYIDQPDFKERVRLEKYKK